VFSTSAAVPWHPSEFIRLSAIMQVCLENKLLQLKSLALQDWTACAAKSMNTNFKDRFANKANSHRKKPEAVVIVYDFPPRFDLLT